MKKRSLVTTNTYTELPKVKESFVDLDTQSMASGASAAFVRKKSLKENRVIGGHGMAVRDKRTGAVAHKLHDEDITAKEFGEGDNNGKEAQTWKNREKDWYNAERRFIFATKTED